MTITTQRWEDFLDLVADVRQLQGVYRRTVDQMIRREVERLELLLDATVKGITDELAEAAIDRAEASIEAEPDVVAIAADGKGGAS